MKYHTKFTRRLEKDFTLKIFTDLKVEVHIHMYHTAELHTPMCTIYKKISSKADSVVIPVAFSI